MQLINTRDLNGYIIKPEHEYPSEPYYIYCPITDGFRTMKLCRACTMHAGYDKKYRSIWCIEPSKGNMPHYFNR